MMVLVGLDAGKFCSFELHTSCELPFGTLGSVPRGRVPASAMSSPLQHPKAQYSSGT
jgi:hypothetical protein